jgi:hypothetical protein
VRVNPVLVFFTLGGAALVAVSYMPGVVQFLDENASPGSDPAGPVLQMIGWIWLAVSLVPLIFSVVAKRKGLDKRFKTFVDQNDDEDNVNVTLPTSFSSMVIGGQQTAASGLTQSLEQLAKLHQMGVLNDEQFEQAKTQLLNQPQPPSA